ncbi:MAG: glucose-6-phosphate dehydrogenase [Candidatus Saccharimonadales bacterium]
MNDNQLKPAIFVIFGITGNLAQRRLLPALYHLIKDDLLDERTEIVGVSRRQISVDELLKKVELCVLETDNVCDPKVLSKFRAKLQMLAFDPTNEADYDQLLKTLATIEDKQGTCMNRLFYLSIPPQVYGPVIRNFGKHRLNEGCLDHDGSARLLVEKPFGYDLESARDLISLTNQYFSEAQVFRIDHYLAKETVQNLLVFRNSNPIFANQWNKDHISGITINLDEQIGIEGRSDFYNSVGALRDVVQNHLLQLLALVTMELPDKTSDSADLHKAKQAVLAAIKPINMAGASVIRGQYEGYREEVGNPHSNTETFVSLSLSIDNARWQGVPIRLTTGKALKSQQSTIKLSFGSKEARQAVNTLTFRIQPNEGIDIELVVKRPGYEHKTETVQMDFGYHDSFTEPQHPDAYERVLVDAVKGDHSLFTTSQEVLSAWAILQPVLDAWQKGGADLKSYQPGSAGPTINNL